ncbi:MAG: ATP-dependent DNA helicase RecG [Patescibacteria group bacterium]
MFFLFTDPISNLPGIGPALALKFQKLGVLTVANLIDNYPRRWEDLSVISPLAQAQPDHRITAQAKLISLAHFRSPYKRMFISNGIIQDSSGPLPVTWFNQPYLQTTLKKGETYFFSGKVGTYQNKPTLMSPVFERVDQDHAPLHAGRIVPIYAETAGIGSKVIRRVMKTLLNTLRHQPEILPESIVKKYQLMSQATALENIHFPASLPELDRAKYRLSFDELFMIQLSLVFIKHTWNQQTSQPITTTNDFMDKFSHQLDFRLTLSQIRAIKDILRDLSSSRIMNRLLLGDVGSGKTVVAAAAIVASVQNGYQVALMAPTEVLAVQHYYSLSPLMEKFGIRTTLLTGSIKLASASEIAEGKIDLVIGTHALIQKQVAFDRLNLVIVDEQHRFGVAQRYQLKNKSAGTSPHFLSLSATPIPRTIFLALFSDLDVSALTDIPRGRLPIITRLATANNLTRVQALINKEIVTGHQIFVITPLIAEDTKTQRASIASEIKNLSRLFPKARTATLHGRIPAEKKLKIMRDFKAGQIDILLATSVIEVGIDIPTATVIWIKDAERFGLAGLHQLRGRVGRSTLQSYCLIETKTDDLENSERLRAFIKIKDGTALAKMDLALRGPGAFFDTQQSGFLRLKIANLMDEKLIKTTHQAAINLIQTDPLLKNHPALKQKLQLNFLPHSE